MKNKEITSEDIWNDEKMEGIKRTILEYMSDIEPNQTFSRYLIELGSRSVDYSYSIDVLYENLNYFKECWSTNLSCYKALEFLSYELDERL